MCFSWRQRKWLLKNLSVLCTLALTLFPKKDGREKVQQKEKTLDIVAVVRIILPGLILFLLPAQHESSSEMQRRRRRRNAKEGWEQVERDVDMAKLLGKKVRFPWRFIYFPFSSAVTAFYSQACSFLFTDWVILLKNEEKRRKLGFLCCTRCWWRV